MLDELFIRGGPVLYILFGLTFLILRFWLINIYLYLFKVKHGLTQSLLALLIQTHLVQQNISL